MVSSSSSSGLSLLPETICPSRDISSESEERSVLNICPKSNSESLYQALDLPYPQVLQRLVWETCFGFRKPQMYRVRKRLHINNLLRGSPLNLAPSRIVIFFYHPKAPAYTVGMHKGQVSSRLAFRLVVRGMSGRTFLTCGEIKQHNRISREKQGTELKGGSLLFLPPGASQGPLDASVWWGTLVKRYTERWWEWGDLCWLFLLISVGFPIAVLQSEPSSRSKIRVPWGTLKISWVKFSWREGRALSKAGIQPLNLLPEMDQVVFSDKDMITLEEKPVNDFG